MFNMLKQLGPRRLTKTKIAMLASAGLVAASLPFFAPQTIKANNGHNDDSDRGENADALLGTWLVQDSLDPSSVPPNTLLNFTSLETFNAGGGYLESNSGPAAGGPGGQGNWTQTGHHRFAVTELRLGFNLAHAFTGINKIRRSLTLSRDGTEFTGSVQADIFLPDGTLLPFHPAGTFHGTRVPIEPLN